MQPLDKSLRKQLETTVKEARDIAENAARVTLEQLGVGEDKPYSHLSESERELRRKLRAHGRQLGDVLNADGKQEIDWLLEEVSYEHWHRMLFARFLAENDLLMYPDPTHPISITLKECEELAAEEGARNGWELASMYAARMLPQIFRPDSPVFSLTLPPEHERKLEKLLDDLPQEVFLASDSIGWVYQFWQAKRKDEVNASEVKIGARELPAVTQLFTEPYMVSFLLDNSLGAWWASRRLTEEDLRTAIGEEELRHKASLPGIPLDNLRFVKTEEGVWTPAAGTFDSWPEHLSELKTLDPCCGSGHFLVAALLMLVPIRMELEGLSAREAVDFVLLENIHGLEIDKRCVELAAFALALTAWRYPGANGYRLLPELNLACSGLPISAKKDEWMNLADDNTNLRLALEELHKLFQDAPVLGSLINLEASLGKSSLFGLKWEEVGPLLTKALAGEKDEEKAEIGVIARGLSKSANILADKYNWIVTNVPYLAWGKQAETLKKFTAMKYPIAKKDLANVFIERIREQSGSGSVIQIVTPQNWLFLTSYKKQRIKLLNECSIPMLAQLGGGAFESISGEVVKAILITIVNKAPQNSHIRGIDLSSISGVQEKRIAAQTVTVQSVLQSVLLENSDSRILLSDTRASNILADFTYSAQGIGTTDNPRFVQSFWEQFYYSPEWETFQTSCKLQSASLVSGYSSIFRWGGPGKDFFNHIEALKKENRIGGGWQAGGIVWGRKGLAVNVTGKKHIALYSSGKFDTTTGVIVPNDTSNLATVASFLLSDDFEEQIAFIDPTLSVTEGTLIKVPFDLDHWTKIAKEKYPNGLPKPHSDDATQWIFHGHPCGSVAWNEKIKWTICAPLRTDFMVLQVAVARLLGYRWPAELDTEMELADEQREWVNESQELLSFADEDGIVCIPPVRGEASASDRLLDLLAAAYGDAWSNDTLATLLKNSDHEGKTLETWLHDKFFTQHIKLFQHRPFIWHIWDGLRDGFAVLVNYHKLDSKLLESLIYTYLGDWISRQKQDIANGVDSAQEKLDAAESLKKKLELILKGEKPYDIFVRWKPIENQPIGWDPDLNDGVRMNIRPFMSVPDVGKKGAGILRDKPNIKWDKDRGKDVESAPWYYLFQGDRINDHHLTLEEKKKAREEAI